MENLSLQFNVSAAQAHRAHDAPFDNSIIETLHGVPVSDPFRPLENLKAPATQEWVRRENGAFQDFIAPAAAVEAEAVASLEKMVPQGMRESMPGRHGDQYAVWRKGKDEERWSLYLKDVPDYGAPARVLLDPLQIDPSGKTNIVDIDFTRDGKTLAYQLSVSGSDETTVRFMDVATGADLGLTYAGFRSGLTWDRDGQGFHYRRPVEGKPKSFEVCHHRMGTEPADDKVVFTPATQETSASYFRISRDFEEEAGSYEWVSLGNTERSKNAILVRPLGSDEAFREIFPHKEGTLSPIHEINGKIYAMTNLGAPNKKLVAFDVDHPGPDQWETILPENPDDPLTSVFAWQNMIFAVYSHDTGEVMKVFDLSGNYLHDVPLPPLSTFSMGSFKKTDTECLLSCSNFQEDGAIYRYDALANTLTLHHPSETPADLKDCIVERVQAVSKDGTKVPMTVIRRPDVALDGTAAALMYGYGGFSISLTPDFSPSIVEWVRAGGIYIQTNLRGGGEYGQKWYDGGRLDKKQNVFDDFAACAQYLIDQHYTSPQRLAIEGGSNGGLLTLATMIQHPELFGAVVSDVPVADMFRFHIGSFYGFSWKSDYGDPDVKADFNVAARYSPLHNVPPGFTHPPLLIKTDANDDRVLPWHSFKMAATMQSLENPDSVTLLSVRTDGGHSAGLTEHQWYEDTAVVRAFLHQAIGPVDQGEYKATRAPAP